MYCKNCGNELCDNVSFCDKCGNNVEAKVKSPQTNVLATIGMITSFISLLLNFWGIVGIVAVIFSCAGLIQASETGENGKGMAVTGILIGTLSIIYGFVTIMMLV